MISAVLIYIKTAVSLYYKPDYEYKIFTIFLNGHKLINTNECENKINSKRSGPEKVYGFMV